MDEKRMKEIQETDRIRREDRKIREEAKRIDEGVYLWYIIKRNTNVRITQKSMENTIWIDYSDALEYAGSYSKLTGHEYVPISVFDYNVMFKRFME